MRSSPMSSMENLYTTVSTKVSSSFGFEMEPEREKAWYEKLEEEVCGQCPSMTWSQRIWGCMICMICGFFISMGSMFKNALTGLTGSNNNSVKIGGAGGGQATKLQNKLFTSLKSRSNKLNENLVELASLQNNLNAKTNMIKNEVHGLQEQFKLYNKMAGGRKSRKKRYKSKNHSRHRRKTKHRRRRRRKH